MFGPGVHVGGSLMDECLPVVLAVDIHVAVSDRMKFFGEVPRKDSPLLNFVAVQIPHVRLQTFHVLRLLVVHHHREVHLRRVVVSD